MRDYTLAQVFKPADRVELHPGVDAWMQGDRYGSITRVLTVTDTPYPLYHVKLDKSDRTLKLAADRLRLVR